MGPSIKDGAFNDAALTFAPTPVDFERGFVNHADTTAPSIVADGISVPDGNYVTGANLDVDITFSEIVNVVGAPTIVIDVGGTDQTAAYVSGSGSATLTFRYAVQTGDSDQDGIGVKSPIALGSGMTIKDGAFNDAALTFAPTPVDFERGFVNHADTTAPSIATDGISVPDGNYVTGNNLDVDITFSEIVNVVGAPTIVIDVGGTDQTAAYVSGSGSATLTFRYVVQTGDSDQDGIGVKSPIALGSGMTIKDGAFNDAALTFAPTPVDFERGFVNHADTTAPSITADGISVPDGNYVTGANLDVDITFSEIVNVVGAPTIVIDVGGTDQTAAYVSGSGSATLTFRYAVQTGDSDQDGIGVKSPITLGSGMTIKDGAFNDAALTFAPTPVDFERGFVNHADTTAPSITADGISVPDGNYVTGANLDVDITFSEIVNVVGAPTIVIDVGGTDQTAAYVSGSGSATLTFRYAVQTGDSDQDGIGVKSPITLGSGMTIKDGAFNDAALTFAPTPVDFERGFVNHADTTAPSITADGISVPDGNYVTGANLDVDITFSEIVNVVGAPTIVIDVGGTDQTAAYVSGSGSATLTFRYAVQTGDSDQDGIGVKSPITLGSGMTIKDGAFNDAALTFAPTPVDFERGFVNHADTTAPSIVADGISVPDGNYVTGANLDVDITFSEIVNVVGAPTIVIDVGGTDQTAAYVSGSGSATLTFRYAVQTGDSDQDGIGVKSPITLGSGMTIKDGAFNDAALTFAPTPVDFERGFVNHADTTAPSITADGISVPDGNYVTGANLDVDITFSEIVNVVGAPTIVIDVGGTDQTAAYVSGSGSATLTFRYAVQTGDSDQDGIGVKSPITLGSGMTIKDGAFNDATLTFAPTPVDFERGFVNHADTTAPSIMADGISVSDGNYVTGANLDVDITFSETVNVVGAPTIVIDVGGTDQTAAYVSGSGSTTLTFRYVVQTGDSDQDGIGVKSPITLGSGMTIKDGAFNDAALTFALTFAPTPVDFERGFVNHADTTAPSITADGISVPDGNYVTGNNLDVDITFSEIVNVVGAPTIVIDVGGTDQTAAYVSGSGSATLTFRYAVQTGDSDQDGIGVKSPITLGSGMTIKDGAFNDAALTFAPTPVDFERGFVNHADTTAPSIVADGISVPDGNYVTGANLDVDITFSEIVNVVGAPTIVIDVGGTDQTAAYVSGSGSATLTFRYAVQTGDSDQDGIGVKSPITLGSGITIKDGAFNDATLTFAPTPVDFERGFVNHADTTAPSIVADGISVPDGNYVTGANLDVDITFSETVNVVGAPTVMIDVGGTDQTAAYVSGSGSATLTFRYVVQTGDSDQDGIGVKSPIALGSGITIKDEASNDATLTFTPTPANFARGFVNNTDSTAPSITADGISVSDGTYVMGNNLDVDITFSEIVNVVGAPTIVIDVGGTDRTATYVSGSDGDATLTFRYVVQSGESDEDGIEVKSPINLVEGITIRDAAFNDAMLTFTPSTTRFSAAIVDSTAPSIGSVSVESGTHAILLFTVDMSEEVVVDTNSGVPRMILDIDGNTRYATYRSGSGTDSLLFFYRADSTDKDDTGGIGMTSSLSLNNGIIRDRANNVLTDLTFALPSNIAQVNVDGSLPIVKWARVYNENYEANDNIEISIMYEEAVTVTGIPRIQLDIGGNTKYATYSSGTGEKLLTFSYTVLTGETDANGISMKRFIDLPTGANIITTGNSDKVDRNFDLPANLSFVKVNTPMPFIFRVRTTSANETFTLPIFNYSMSNGVRPVYNFTVDWGDGSSSGPITSEHDSEKIHTYVQAGEYTVTIAGTIQSWDFLSRSTSKDLITEIVDLGDVGWVDLSNAFNRCDNLTSVSGGVLSSVISAENMFAKSFGSSGVFVAVNVQGWDVSNITNMSEMFYSQLNLVNLDLRTWDVSNVTDMQAMFYRIPANMDLSDWDVSSVTNMESLFQSVRSTSLNISTWDVSSVTNMGGMFRGSTSVNPNVDSWDVSSVTNMNTIFQEATSANPNVKDWNVSSVTNMAGMFKGATSAAPNVSNWDVSNVTNMDEMFKGATSANPDVSSWDISNVTRMISMFEGATSANPDFSGRNFGSIQADTTNTVAAYRHNALNDMFTGATSFTAANYSNLLIALEGSNSNSNIRLAVPSGLGSSITADAQTARTNLRDDHTWTISD